MEHDAGGEQPTAGDIAAAVAMLKPSFYSAGYPEVPLRPLPSDARAVWDTDLNLVIPVSSDQLE